MSRVRGWCFTLNGPDSIKEDYLYQFSLEDIRYLVFSYEIGEITGNEHIQGYIYFTNPKYIQQVTKIMPHCHLAVAAASPLENRVYIVGPYEKEGKIKPFNEDHVEFGEMPVKGKVTYDKLQLVMRDPTSNFQLYTQYRKSYREHQATIVDVDRHRVFDTTVPQAQWIVKARDMIRLGYTVCTDIDTYNSEQVLFVHVVLNNDLKNTLHQNALATKLLQWKAGLPPLIRYGYEFIRLDPVLVYIIASEDSKAHPAFAYIN